MSDIKVSYALQCYQQEGFVREAVRSAFAQDYAPMEIILSDDASTDRTYEILEEEAKNYRGPNLVTFNRNKKNMGIEHLNKLVKIAKGDLIILAHGDDIAAPHRARKLADVWAEQKVSVLSSNAWVMDGAGQTLGILCGDSDSHAVGFDNILQSGWSKMLLGASLAFDREIFAAFGPLDRRIIPVGTDHILPFRAAVLRGMYYVGEPLLYWRQHAKNLGDMIGDKTGTNESFVETYTGYGIMTMVAMVEDLLRLQKRGGRKRELSKLQDRLTDEIGDLLRKWMRQRNELYLHGKRPAWIDKEELAKNPIKQDYRVFPDLPAGGSGGPGKPGGKP